jgi:arginyl-tRNA synthetase
LQQTVATQAANLRGTNQPQRVNLEYVSANPTGYLHLAHLRQAVIGSALANIYRFLGYPVTREYYINDRGQQIEQLAHSLHHFYLLKQGIASPATQLAYSGTASQEVAAILVDQVGDKFVNLKETDSSQ